MTYVFSSMESPHWLIVAGTALLILGFIGLALFSRRDAGDYEMASGEEQGRSEPEADLAHTQAGDRKAKLEEQKRDRWANKDRSAENPLNDRLKVSDKETQ
jgi:hypothetical protein